MDCVGGLEFPEEEEFMRICGFTIVSFRRKEFYLEQKEVRV